MDLIRKIISTEDLSREEISSITSNFEKFQTFPDKRMTLLFFSPSTRTRLSYAKALDELQMKCLMLNPNELRYIDGETLEDSAIAIGTYCDIIGIRIHGSAVNHCYPRGNELLMAFAKSSTKPIINLECDKYHPSQALADLKTIRDNKLDSPNNKIVISWAYSPDALRVPAMPNELILLFSRWGLNVTIAHPKEFYIDDEILELAKKNASNNGGNLEISHHREGAMHNATIIYPRNWTTVNIGHHGLKSEIEIHKKYSDWCYTSDDFSNNCSPPYFMHCLPIHRGFEASDDIIDGTNSLIHQQMRNRVPVQKRLIHQILGNVPFSD